MEALMPGRSRNLRTHHSLWVVLGFLLPCCIVVCLVALRWIGRGGLEARSTQEFFAEQREIARWLRDG